MTLHHIVKFKSFFPLFFLIETRDYANFTPATEKYLFLMITSNLKCDPVCLARVSRTIIATIIIIFLFAIHLKALVELYSLE